MMTPFRMMPMRSPLISFVVMKFVIATSTQLSSSISTPVMEMSANAIRVVTAS